MTVKELLLTSWGWAWKPVNIRRTLYNYFDIISSISCIRWIVPADMWPERAVWELLPNPGLVPFCWCVVLLISFGYAPASKSVSDRSFPLSWTSRLEWGTFYKQVFCYSFMVCSSWQCHYKYECAQWRKGIINTKTVFDWTLVRTSKSNEFQTKIF